MGEIVQAVCARRNLPAWAAFLAVAGDLTARHLSESARGPGQCLEAREASSAAREASSAALAFLRDRALTCPAPAPAPAEACPEAPEGLPVTWTVVLGSGGWISFLWQAAGGCWCCRARRVVRRPERSRFA